MTTKRMTLQEMPTSFGTFKPVGHVVVALPDEPQAAAAREALLAAGFAPEDVLHFSAREERNAMHRMIENAGDMVEFGHEIVLMKRYEALARDGCSWLIVHAPGTEPAQRVAQVARDHGALLAVKYDRLIIEDLI